MDGQVDVAQHPLLAVTERHVPKLYLMLEGFDGAWLCGFLDGVLSHQDFVDTLHRGQSLGYVVAGFREIFQGVDDAVEHHHVIDKEGAGERTVVQHQYTAEPQDDNNHHRAEKLGHGVG